MAHALGLFFDDSAEEAVRALWKRLEAAGVPSLASRGHRRHRPHVTLAVAGRIPEGARRDLRAELSLLSVPDLWLYTLGTFPSDESVLLLGAVVDTELIAVHSAVHDVLAGKVSAPSAYYFPGAWIPHCTLAIGITGAELATGFAELCPPEPIRAPVSEIGVIDTRTGEVEPVLAL
ncbi:2'-5' RNA ligase family protein [Saccharopolyspora erythraea]|uniref:2'-5' RNA ligase family protein n=1 Tax=Saccharopolyspora erythraea TaxID=1836 RepID=UPI001BA9E9A0|nr:2'-5' RNA ligase family protein [Saccharopolyspora erythraea]QUG99780.1 2'-5' RNA ligase family protein [Saccharopolyspora erythraea]